MDYKIFLYRIITAILLLFILFLCITKYSTFLSLMFYVIYIAIFLEIILYFKKYNYIYFFSIFYIFISFVCIKYYFDYLFNLQVFLYTISIIIIFDISSYIFGSTYGKSKILPKISPNKTILGFNLGFITTIIISFILNFMMKIISINVSVFFIILILLSAFLGDVLESIFKRNAKIKNSSNLLPGHGGFFDRFDSFLMAFNSLCIFNYFFKFYAYN